MQRRESHVSFSLSLTWPKDAASLRVLYLPNAVRESKSPVVSDLVNWLRSHDWIPVNFYVHKAGDAQVFEPLL